MEEQQVQAQAVPQDDKDKVKQLYAQLSNYPDPNIRKQIAAKGEQHFIKRFKEDSESGSELRSSLFDILLNDGFAPDDYNEWLGSILPEKAYKAPEPPAQLGGVQMEEENLIAPRQGSIPLLPTEDMTGVAEPPKKKERGVVGGLGFGGTGASDVGRAIASGIVDRVKLFTQKGFNTAKGIFYGSGMMQPVVERAVTEGAKALYGAIADIDPEVSDNVFTYGDAKNKLVLQELTGKVNAANAQFQKQLEDSGLPSSTVKAIKEGRIQDLPDAVAYNIADLGMQIVAGIATRGGSIVPQILSESYSSGVNEIAKATNRTPDQVIQAGDDEPAVAIASTGLQAALENVGLGMISKTMKGSGASKVIRQYIGKKYGKGAGEVAANVVASGGETLTEIGQEGVAIIQEAINGSTPEVSAMDILKQKRDSGEIGDRILEIAGNVFAGTSGTTAIGRGLHSSYKKKVDEGAKEAAQEEVTGDGSTRRVVVDSIEQVPAEYRDSAVEVTTGPPILGRMGIGTKKQYAYNVPVETIEVGEVAAPSRPDPTTASQEEVEAALEADIAGDVDPESLRGIAPDAYVDELARNVQGLREVFGTQQQDDATVRQTAAKVDAFINLASNPNTDLYELYDDAANSDLPDADKQTLLNLIDDELILRERNESKAEETVATTSEGAAITSVGNIIIQPEIKARTVEVAVDRYEGVTGDINGQQGSFTVTENGNVDFVGQDGQVTQLDGGRIGFVETIKDDSGTVVGVVLADAPSGLKITVNDPEIALDLATMALQDQLQKVEISDGEFQNAINSLQLQNESQPAPQTVVSADDVADGGTAVAETDIVAGGNEVLPARQVDTTDVVVDDSVSGTGDVVVAEEGDATGQQVGTAENLGSKKASLDEKAKKLGYIGIKQFNAQNQLNENLTDAEKALLQEYSDFQQEIKNLKDENVIAKLSDDEFSSWSKANDITRDDLGKVVKDEEIELAAKRIRILNARGDSKKAESEFKKLKESKKKDNWTIESWKERFDEDVEQSEIDEINQSNKVFNDLLDNAVKSFEQNAPTPAPAKPKAEPAKTEQISQKQSDTEKKPISLQNETGTKQPVAGNRLFNKPIEAAKKIADRYFKAAFGTERVNFEGTRKLDKERAKRIADAYAAMKNDPNNPEVKAAYEAMVKETIDQYKEIIKDEYFIEVNNEEAYANSEEMIEDLRNNKRMKIFSTESGYGDSPITDQQRKENPLLRDSGFKDKNGVPLLNNDIFRAVHDFFGHAELGNSFGALGEENAWNVHSRMYSPLARKAVTTETRGQNSYVNFSGVNEEAQKLLDQAAKLRSEGKYEEALKITESIYEKLKFADQKIGLLPDEFTTYDDETAQQPAQQPAPAKRTRRPKPTTDTEALTALQDNLEISEEEAMTVLQKFGGTTKEGGMLKAYNRLTKADPDTIANSFDDTNKTEKALGQKVADWAKENFNVTQAAKDIADRIRSKKIDGALSSFDFGLTPTIYNGALEFMASQVEKGTKLGNAIANTLKWIDEQMKGAKWNKGAFGKYMNDTYSVTLSDGREVEVIRDDSKQAAEVINGWYQPIEQAILDTKEDKLPANKWAERLRSKEDEDLWTGVREFLADKGTQPVTKQELKDFIKDNRVEIVEVVKGGRESEWSDDWVKTDSGFSNGAFRLYKGNNWKLYNNLTNEEIGIGGFDNLEGAKMRAKDEWKSNKTDTKFSQYQLEGDKTDYKEVLVTMPRRNNLDIISNEIYQKQYSQLNPEERVAVKRKARERGETVDESNLFKSSHFDEKNILVHLRMNTRKDADGNKVLFLEEIQSDWGQKGKKEGFQEATPKSEIDAVGRYNSIINEKKALLEKASDYVVNNKIPELQEKVDKINDRIEIAKKDLPKSATIDFDSDFANIEVKKSTPPAPFVTDTNSWVKLGLKAALKEAVAQGADKIAWTTGEQQNDRYSLEKVADEVRYSKNEDGTYRVVAYKNGENVSEENRLPESKLEATLGKDVAQRIIDGVGENIEGEKSLTGENLKVGGKGMKGFYGSPTEGSLGIVGNVAKSLFGQEVGTVEIESENFDTKKIQYLADKYDVPVSMISKAVRTEDLEHQAEIGLTKDEVKVVEDFLKGSTTQPSITITPALRKSVEAGLPLFGDAKAKARIATIESSIGTKANNLFEATAMATEWAYLNIMVYGQKAAKAARRQLIKLLEQSGFAAKSAAEIAVDAFNKAQKAMKQGAIKWIDGAIKELEDFQKGGNLQAGMDFGTSKLWVSGLKALRNAINSGADLDTELSKMESKMAAAKVSSKITKGYIDAFREALIKATPTAQEQVKKSAPTTEQVVRKAEKATKELRDKIINDAKVAVQAEKNATDKAKVYIKAFSDYIKERLPEGVGKQIANAFNGLLTSPRALVAALDYVDKVAENKNFGKMVSEAKKAHNKLLSMVNSTKITLQEKATIATLEGINFRNVSPTTLQDLTDAMVAFAEGKAKGDSEITNRALQKKWDNAKAESDEVVRAQKEAAMFEAKDEFEGLKEAGELPEGIKTFEDYQAYLDGSKPEAATKKEKQKTAQQEYLEKKAKLLIDFAVAEDPTNANFKELQQLSLRDMDYDLLVQLNNALDNYFAEGVETNIGKIKNKVLAAQNWKRKMPRVFKETINAFLGTRITPKSITNTLARAGGVPEQIRAAMIGKWDQNIARVSNEMANFRKDFDVLAAKLGLDTPDFTKINIFGFLNEKSTDRTYEEKIQALKAGIKNGLKYVKNNRYNLLAFQKPLRVYRDAEATGKALEEMGLATMKYEDGRFTGVEMIEGAKPKLTKAQEEAYNFVRAKLDELSPAYRKAMNTYFGKDPELYENYWPSSFVATESSVKEEQAFPEELADIGEYIYSSDGSKVATEIAERNKGRVGLNTKEGYYQMVGENVFMNGIWDSMSTAQLGDAYSYMQAVINSKDGLKKYITDPSARKFIQQFLTSTVQGGLSADVYHGATATTGIKTDQIKAAGISTTNAYLYNSAAQTAEIWTALRRGATKAIIDNISQILKQSTSKFVTYMRFGSAKDATNLMRKAFMGDQKAIDFINRVLDKSTAAGRVHGDIIEEQRQIEGSSDVVKAIRVGNQFVQNWTGGNVVRPIDKNITNQATIAGYIEYMKKYEPSVDYMTAPVNEDALAAGENLAEAVNSTNLASYQPLTVKEDKARVAWYLKTMQLTTGMAAFTSLRLALSPNIDPRVRNAAIQDAVGFMTMQYVFSAVGSIILPEIINAGIDLFGDDEDEEQKKKRRQLAFKRAYVFGTTGILLSPFNFWVEFGLMSSLAISERVLAKATKEDKDPFELAKGKDPNLFFEGGAPGSTGVLIEILGKTLDRSVDAYKDAGAVAAALAVVANIAPIIMRQGGIRYGMEQYYKAEKRQKKELDMVFQTFQKDYPQEARQYISEYKKEGVPLSFFSNLVVTKDNYFLIVKPQYAKGYYNNYISAFEIAKKAYNAQDWLSEVKKVNESDKKGYIAEKFYVREGELRNAMAESAKDFAKMKADGWLYAQEKKPVEIRVSKKQLTN